MSDQHTQYENPLIARYASPAMSELWSPQRKFSTWRRLWVALAEAEAELGLPVSQEQIAELKQHVDDIDFAAAERHERRLRHDVMAHVHAYGDVCPKARPIIHLGATSCYVTDNTDLILLREALEMVRDRLVAVIDGLARFAQQHRALPCLAFTHFQPAQPTTVGKRACLWAYDFVLDLAEIEFRLANLKAHGSQGHDRHAGQLPGPGRRRSREGPAAGRTDLPEDRFCGKLRRHRADLSAEDRLAGPGRVVRHFPKRAQDGHRPAAPGPSQRGRRTARQGADRILGDGLQAEPHALRADLLVGPLRDEPGEQRRGDAGRAMAGTHPGRQRQSAAGLPQSFLATDAVLILCQNVTDGLVVYPRVIGANLDAELPFMATENILMAAVAAGGDRQDLHERIRRHSLAAAAVVKNEGGRNDLIDRIAADPAFAKVDLTCVLDPAQFVGRAPQQVDEFLAEVIEPIRAKYGNNLKSDAEVRV